MNNKVYIASSILNHRRVIDIANKLIKRYDMIITYDWTPHARAILDGNPPKGEKQLSEIAERELKGVINSDAILVLMPGRTGTHFEYGVAYALNKPIVYLNDNDDLSDEEKFMEPLHHLDGVEYFTDEDEALHRLFYIQPIQNHPIIEWSKDE